MFMVEGAGPYGSITLIKAVQLLINEVLKKFVQECDVQRQSFRDDKLWKPDCRLLYSMNEQNLRNLYSSYVANERGRGIKDNSCQFMVEKDCQKLILADAKLTGLNKYHVTRCFVMSKMSVVEESAPDAVLTYKKLQYVEFLEFLARIAELYFEGSEMEELQLHEKLEYLLDELLPLVNAKRVKQVVVIEEFSESDEDY